MTRKHYKAIAQVLNSHRGEIPEQAFSALVRDLASVMKANNGAFDRSRFEDACTE